MLNSIAVSHTSSQIVFTLQQLRVLLVTLDCFSFLFFQKESFCFSHSRLFVEEFCPFGFYYRVNFEQLNINSLESRKSEKLLRK